MRGRQFKYNYDEVIEFIKDKSCSNCEMYMFDHENNKMVCAGGKYGVHTLDSDICDDWECEIGVFMDMCCKLDV